MYFFNSKALAQDIKTHKVSIFSKTIYTLSLCIQMLFKMGVWNFAPFLYYFTFGHIKKYIEQKTQHPTLIIEIFNQNNDIFNLILFSIIIIGLLSLILMCWKKNQHCIRNTIYINFPITVRIITITTILFAIITGIAFYYFGNQLMALIPEKERISLKPWKIIFRVLREVKPTKPWRAIFKIFKEANLVNTISQNLGLLKKAQAIFENINLFSLWMYVACYVSAILSTIIYFFTMIRRLKEIYKR